MRWKITLLALLLACARGDAPVDAQKDASQQASDNADLDRDVVELGLEAMPDAHSALEADMPDPGFDTKPHEGQVEDAEPDVSMDPEPLALDAALDADWPEATDQSALAEEADEEAAAESEDSLGEAVPEDTSLDGDVLPDQPGPPTPVCGHVELWSRRVKKTGGAVTINEVMYNPGPAAKGQWVELYNPMAIDVDLSLWHIEGDIKFTFPEGTFMPGRSYLVVSADPAALPNALGPFVGELRREGVVELYNNKGRLMDSVHYRPHEPWPVSPDGSGASLSKVHPHRLSEEAESWRGSMEVGGTPGVPNFPDSTPGLSPVFLEDGQWRFASSVQGDWMAQTADDSAWSSGTGPFFSSEEQGPVQIVARLTADNFFAIYVAKKDGTDLRFIGRDSVTDWTSPEEITLLANPCEHVFVAAWEDVWGDQGPQMWIGEFVRPDGSVLRTSKTTFSWALGPKAAAPGGSLQDPPPPLAQVLDVIKTGEFAAPLVEADRMTSPWGWAVGQAFGEETRYIWADTFDSMSVTNANTTYALFRSNEPVYPGPEGTMLSAGAVTYYFRKAFDTSSYQPGTRFYLSVRVRDGAVVYLDGKEVLRLGMPEGPVGPETLALGPADEPLSKNGLELVGLAPGPHLLAAEVHASAVSDPSVSFSAALVGIGDGSGQWSGLVLNEVSSDFVELRNASVGPLDTSGYVVASTGGFVLDHGVLGPGALLVLKGIQAKPGDKVFLYGPGKATVLDGVEVKAEVRARDAERWLYPAFATPGAPNQFALRDDIVINEVMYHHGPIYGEDGSAQSSPEEWVELYNRGSEAVDLSGFQLVDATEFVFPAGTILGPGGYLVVARDAKAMKTAHPDIFVLGNLGKRLPNDGGRLVLLDACGNPVDEVRYYDGGRWPQFADGFRASLELMDPRADNFAPEVWAASDEGRTSEWQTVSYTGVATPSPVGPDGQWQEFVMGLLDEGVVLLDDLSVVEDPDGAAKELIKNGTFEAGTAWGWRLLGNHRHSRVVQDPDDPNNHVLMLRSTGATEHMHNHLETTLADGAVITNGRTYRISFRARWVAGSNQLHTRLYFNRLSRTTRLAMPWPNGTPGRPNSTLVANLGPTFSDFTYGPVVPPPYVPVFVSIRATDPDQVAWVKLWWRRDGGEWMWEEMEGGEDGRYLAFLPGQPPGTRVQLYFQGVDGTGTTSMWPASGPDSRVLYVVDDGRAKKGPLHDLRVIMLKADADWLFTPTNVMSNDHIRATVVYDESEVYPDVGVRIKGSERGRPVPVRVGFAIFFDPARPFWGVLDSVMIDRSAGVQFGQREMLIQQVICRAGAEYCKYDDLVHLVAPRPEYDGPAQLQLARFEDIMLDSQFEAGSDGDLFEYELIYYPTTTDDGTPEGLKLPQPDLVVGTPIKDLGPDKEAYRFNYIIKGNRWKDDYQRLMEFARAFGKSGVEFETLVGNYIDTDEWLRAFAFGVLSGAVDNYATGAQHNAFFYVRPSDQLVLYFPYDLDFYGSNPNTPIVPNADLAKLIAAPTNFRRYYGHLYDITSRAYNPDYLAHWCGLFKALLPGQDFESYCAFMNQRYTWVTATAPNAIPKAVPKVAFEITTNEGADFSTEDTHVVLSGKAWIDVNYIRRAGEKLPLDTLFDTVDTWHVDIPLLCGPNVIGLEAVDFAGNVVGSDQITVTLTACM